MKRSILTAIVAGAALSASAMGQASDPVIYDNGIAGLGNTGLSSQNDAVYPFDSQVADDFVLGANNVVTGVSWEGLYFNTPPGANATAFNIFFYADDGFGTGPAGGPGTEFASAIIPVGSIQIIQPVPGVENYSYSADLPASVSIPSGTTTWIAIQAESVFPPQWGWDGLTQPGGNATQGFPLLGTPYWTTYDDGIGNGAEMDFVLHGVPAPASVALLGLGGLVATRRRR